MGRPFQTWSLALVVALLLLGSVPWAAAFLSTRKSSTKAHVHQATPNWSQLEDELGDSYRQPLPYSIDTALEDSRPSSSKPILYRERHGWCPYSERVWLALELAQVDYDTVRIDNTGGPRPSYFAGQTPQMQFAKDSRRQGESMDLVNRIDQEYNNGAWGSSDPAVQELVREFSRVFPRARPSSRAAFLFQYNGEPLWRSVFEETLQKTDDLLGTTSGPWFGGDRLTVADLAWAPFLERYRYQLPCLHAGLQPDDATVFPHLAAWYAAMDDLPTYACRVQGDAASWRKVLTMAGFGNAGVPPPIQATMDDRVAHERAAARAVLNSSRTGKIWADYAAPRSYVASSPHREAAATLVRNRAALVRDTVRQASRPAWKKTPLPVTEEQADQSLRELAQCLLSQSSDDENPNETTVATAQLTVCLDERMCVPRDMGAIPAAAIKTLAMDLEKKLS